MKILLTSEIWNKTFVYSCIWTKSYLVSNSNKSLQTSSARRCLLGRAQLLHSQTRQLWLSCRRPAQEQAHQHFITDGEGSHEPPPFPWHLLVNGSWLLGEDESLSSLVDPLVSSPCSTKYPRPHPCKRLSLALLVSHRKEHETCSGSWWWEGF